MSQQHTATPWKQFDNRVYGPDEQPAHDSDISDYRDLIARASSNDDAAFIVRAVNAHDAYAKAVKLFDYVRNSGRADLDADEVEILEAALKLAEGEGAETDSRTRRPFMAHKNTLTNRKEA